MKRIIFLLLILVNYFIINAQEFTIKDLSITTLTTVDKSIGGYLGTFDDTGNIQNTSAAAGSYNNPLFSRNQIDSFAPINIQTMRFPVNNYQYYHFGSSKAGYGIDSTEMFYNDKWVGGSNTTNRAANIHNKMTFDRQYTKNIIYDFIRTVKELQIKNGSTINVIYTANCYQHLLVNGGTYVATQTIDHPTYRSILPGNGSFNGMLQETMSAIQLLKDSSINVVGVEFDNEAYDWPIMTVTNLSTRFIADTTMINNYISIIKVYTDSLRGRWSGFKVAVPLKQNGGLTGNELNKRMLAQTFYDAFSFHVYTQPSAVNGGCTDIGSACSLNDYKCVLKSVNYQINGTTCTGTTNNKLDHQLSIFDTKYKEYWILEWNLSEGGTAVTNSLVQADYLYKMYFSEFIPNSNIKNCIFWGTSGIYDGTNTSGSGYWGFLMKNDFGHMIDWCIRKQATYYPATYVGNIFKNDYKLINVDWKNWNSLSAFQTSSFTGIDKDSLLIRVFMPALTNPLSNTKIIIYFSNMSTKKIHVNYDSMRLNTPYYACSGSSGSKNLTFKTDFGEHPGYYDNVTMNCIKQQTLATEDTIWTNYLYQTAATCCGYNYNNSDTIFPFSVGMIEVTLHKNPTDCGETGRKANPKINNSKITTDLYPNPTTGIVNLSFGAASEKEIFVYDSSGKLIFRKKTNGQTYQIDLSGFAKGIYNYIIDSGPDKQTGKILLQ